MYEGRKNPTVSGNEQQKGSYFTDFEGVVNNLERRFRETNSAGCAMKSQHGMNVRVCRSAMVIVLNKTVLAVTVGGLNISEFCRLSVVQALGIFGKDAADFS
jgi:excinuclease ABC subunit A